VDGSFDGELRGSQGMWEDFRGEGVGVVKKEGRVKGWSVWG